jgi:hypothetical protein
MHRLAAVLSALFLVGLAMASPALGQEVGQPGNDIVQTPSGAGASPAAAQGQTPDITDPKVANPIVDNAIDETVVHLTDVPSGFLDTIKGWQINVFTGTPSSLTYLNQAVLSVWIALSLAAVGALGLNTLWTGLKIVHAPWSGVRPVRDLWLVAFGAFAILTSVFFCRVVIELNNILCVAAGSADPKDLFMPRPSGHNDLAVLVASFFEMVMAALVALKLIVRMAMVMVLVATSGIGFYAWTTPETRWLGHLWLHGFVGWTMGQFLTVAFLKLGQNLTHEITGSDVGGSIAAYLLGFVVMAFAYGVPDLIARYVSLRSGVPGILSTAANMVVGAGTRAALGAFAGDGGAAATAGAAAAAAPAATGSMSSGWTNSATRKAANFVPGGLGPRGGRS